MEQGNDRAQKLLAEWDDCGALSWDELVRGEMETIRRYMAENRLPWGFLRIAFEMGATAYLSLHQKLPAILPMPFRKDLGSGEDAYAPMGEKRNEER